MQPNDLKNAIEFAKKNPADPRAKELRRRIESGALNKELEAAGMRTFEVKKPAPPKVDLNRAMQGVQMQPGLQSTPPQPSDLGGDMKEMGTGIVSDVTNRVTKGADILQSDQNQFSKGLQLAGQGAGIGVDIISRLVGGAAKAAVGQDTEDAVKEKTMALLETPAGKAAVSAIEAGQEKWGEFRASNPEFAANLEAIVPLTEMFGAGVVSRPVGAAVNTVAKQVPKALEATATATDAATSAIGKTVGPAIDAARKARVEKLSKGVDDAVGRIVQGTPDDIAAARRSLSALDTDGVKTYKELNTRIEEKLEALNKRQDTELGKYPDAIKREHLSRYQSVEGLDGKKSTVADTPVVDALEQLKTFYEKVRNTAGVRKIEQYQTKLDTDGLTVGEINAIARMHGKELNAYNANGELASGLTRQAAENTRMGVKDTLRQRTPDDASQAIDKEISELIKTQTLTRDMEESVNQLYQKIKNRTLMQKVGGVAAEVVDLLSLGTMRGFIAKITPPNVGFKTANALDLQAELKKNIAKIKQFNEIKDPQQFADAIKEYMDELQPGLSTRVSSGLTNEQKDGLLEKLYSLNSQSFLDKDGMIDSGLLELQERLDVLKKAAERPRGLTEREYVELRELMDEFDTK